jgi:hypothetical protein
VTTRDDFVALHPYAFLVSATSSSQSMPFLKPTEFRTVTHREQLKSAASNLEESLLVLPLRKLAGNPFPERISIGRATNCDLVIRDASVSKLHGHFRDVTATSAVFTDAKSSNGTRLDGTLVQPGIPAEIHLQSLISFGRVALMFLGASDVYDWL